MKTTSRNVGKKPGRGPDRNKSRTAQRSTGPYWIYGRHPVAAALANPARHCTRLIATTNGAQWLGQSGTESQLKPEIMQADKLVKQIKAGPIRTGQNSGHQEPGHHEPVHQGLALQVAPLSQVPLEQILSGPRPLIDGEPAARDIILVVDQITDPGNLGAIIRAAAAFGARAVVATERHSPPESAVLIKASAGAFESVPVLRVPNLVRALDRLAEEGYWRYGLDINGQKMPNTKPDAKTEDDKIVLVLGAEGKGLRRLTLEHCDLLVRLPMSDRVESLNVAAAAAVALYTLATKP